MTDKIDMSKEREALVREICRAVAELPDRNSPEDWPEAMLVTHEELADIVRAALTSSQPVAPAGWRPGQPITEAMHVAAVKVLHRASGVDGLPKRMLDAMLAAAPTQPAALPADDQDGAAFRTAARLGLTLRFYGGCAQSSMPGTPSAYEVVTGQDRATAMREAVERAEAVIAAGGKPLTVAPLPMPDLTTLTERGAAAWAGVDAQALREGRETPVVQEAAPGRDERDDFEKVFPLPSGCIRCGTGYASTGYSNWAAHTHVERWQGWQARAARTLACSAELERLQGRIARIGIDVDRALRGDVNPQSPLGTTRLQAVAAQAADSVLEDAETALRKVLGVVQRYLPPDGPSAHDAISEITAIVDPWPLGQLDKP